MIHRIDPFGQSLPLRKPWVLPPAAGHFEVPMKRELPDFFVREDLLKLKRKARLPRVGFPFDDFGDSVLRSG
jgi:hypothetical protein